MDFDILPSEYVLNNIRIRKLPNIALTALGNGYDCESLRILAGLEGKAEEYEIRQYFEKSLRELGISIPTKEQAIILLSNNVAQRIVLRDISEYDGGKLLWGLADKWPIETSEVPEILWKFKCCASSIEDFQFDMADGHCDHTESINNTKQEILDLAKNMMETKNDWAR
jgi:hypothetical protein